MKKKGLLAPAIILALLGVVVLAIRPDVIQAFPGGWSFITSIGERPVASETNAARDQPRRKPAALIYFPHVQSGALLIHRSDVPVTKSGPVGQLLAGSQGKLRWLWVNATVAEV